MTKKALIVGINTYHSAPLRGCVNDAIMVSNMLSQHFGFKTNEKRMLTDYSATTANILERLRWLVKDAKPGDVLYFHYSGHGSQVIDTNYDQDFEPDGKDEVIVPVDMNWRDKIIKDDDLREIFSTVPEGVNLTVFLDCCHSGTALDHSQTYRPVDGSAVDIPEIIREYGEDSPNRPRLLPMPADIANRGIGMNLKSRRIVADNVKHTTGLLIAGCQSFQTSADAWIDNRYCGAATYSLITTLQRHKYNVTYRQLIEEMNDFMKSRHFTQRPELDGNPKLYNEKFLGEIK